MMMGEPYFLYGADEHRRSQLCNGSASSDSNRKFRAFYYSPMAIMEINGTKRTGTFDVPEGHKQRPHLGGCVCAEGEGKLEETQGKVGIMPEGRTGRLWL